ncbi:capsular biosynthesis protein [Pigmentiphaga aceris]|uniref:Capsular biosynthesis protein n=1 Tax=Pigmentiphaga aceris TaxID=1940612 RepID=A0A5C0B000_9BURK|nr:capsular biosynthesis protein [Pigmentiphaga aceris]QEI07918.1 capsular biosynthesis protein [Pigmentiphaga aceris]
MSSSPIKIEAGAPPMRLGDRFVQAGLLTPKQVEETIALQNAEQLRFGEAAIRLGFLTDTQLRSVLAEQFNYATANATFPNLSPSLRIAHAPFGREAEAIRQIRGELSIRMTGRQRIVLAVVSPGRGEGKSYIATSLAIAFSQAGQRTLLVNANLRASGQQDMLGVGHSTASGLSSILARHAAPHSGQRVPGFPLLHALGPGPQPPNPIEILREPALKVLIEGWSEDFDVIIFDTPASTTSSDAQAIARQAGACLMVARQDVTRVARLRVAQELMRTSGAEALGLVYNEFDPRSMRRGLRNRIGRVLRKLLPSSDD